MLGNLEEKALRVGLFSFEGVKKKIHFQIVNEKVKHTKCAGKVFFAYFLVHKKVCTISSVGRATDS